MWSVYCCRSDYVLAVVVVVVVIVSFLVSQFSFFWVVGVALLLDLLQICCRRLVLFASAHLLLSQAEMRMREEQVTALVLFPPLIQARGEVWEGLVVSPDLFPLVIQVKGEVGMGEGCLW